MAKRFSISGAITLLDKVSPNMGKAARSVTAFGKKTVAAMRRADISARSMNKRMNKVAGPTVKRGMFALSIGAGLVAREFVRFDDAIFGATARFKAAEKPGTNMTKVMENLRAAARKTGAETQFTATLAAQGLDKFALAGFNSEESIKVLRSQVDLATVTGEDFMRVADISSDLLGGFGGAALDSAAKVAKLKQMNALLAVATLSANVTMEDLFETMKQAAPIGTAMGKSMADVIATTSVLGSAGIKGSTAGMAMKNIFLRLINPTAGVSGALRELNLNQRDFVNSAGKMKSTVEIFSLIGKKTKGLEDVKVARLFSELAGLRGTAGALVLAKNIGQVREQLIRMGKDPQKVMAQTATFMRQSLGNQLKIIGSAATEVGFKIISAFSGKGRKGLSDFGKSIQEFDPTFIINSLKVIIFSMKVLFTIIGPFLPLLVGFAIAIKTIVAAQTLWAQRTILMTAVTKAWAVAQAIFNAVMMLNPIFLIGSAIALVIVGVIRLIRMWDKLVTTFKKDGLLAALGQYFGIGGSATINNNTTGAAPVNKFASPGSRGITNNNNTTTNGRVDIGIKGPQGTSVKESGTLPAGMSLDLGFDGAGA